jgi:predicted short-subunit dehydrogenase-like oxidoreductase (DUF2520 family)
MQIVIIGSGNTANMLGKLLQPHHEIVQIVGRNKKTVPQLAKQVYSKYAFSMQQIVTTAQVYIIATNDDAILTIAQQLKVPKALVLHTSGTTSLQVLQQSSATQGVIWPLQTVLLKQQLMLLPFIIDGNNKKALALIKKLIKPIQTSVTVANDEHRKKIHLGAVIANNFTNHLLTLLTVYCKQEKIPLKFYQPILQQTIMQFLLAQSPVSQTGPAIRNDTTTINAHIALLQAYPQLKKLYQQLTQSIQAVSNT